MSPVPLLPSSLLIARPDPPEQVLLRLQPTRVAVGSTFILECRVPAVAPLESFTLTLLRGQQILCSQTFGRASGDPQEAVVTHNATAGREDGHHSFSCRAELDLRALGGDLVSSVSEPRVLDVYESTEPTEPTEPTKDNQRLNIIMGIIALVLLFLVIVLLWLCRKRQNRARQVQIPLEDFND